MKYKTANYIAMLFVYLIIFRQVMEHGVYVPSFKTHSQHNLLFTYMRVYATLSVVNTLILQHKQQPSFVAVRQKVLRGLL